jgi:alpha-glucosidase
MAFQTGVRNEVVAAGGQLAYKVSFQGKPVIDTAAMRLELQGQSPLGSRVRIVGATPSKIDETYRLVAGKASTVRNYCNALRIDLEETGDPGRKLVVEARAYDDAVAFRYLVPEQGAISTFQLTNETTEFRASKDATAYALELPNFRSQYEGEFTKLSVSAFGLQGGVAAKPLIGLPLLMNLPGVAMGGHHRSEPARQQFHVPATRQQLCVPIPPRSTAGERGARRGKWLAALLGVESAACRRRPWQAHRVERRGQPESRIGDQGYILDSPGPRRMELVERQYWRGRQACRAYHRQYEILKYYVDFAAKSGFEHMLVDAG